MPKDAEIFSYLICGAVLLFLVLIVSPFKEEKVVGEFQFVIFVKDMIC